MYQIEKQHARGKLHAIERIQCLLDSNSFREIQSGVTNLEETFGLKPGQFPYDGVIMEEKFLYILKILRL